MNYDLHQNSVKFAEAVNHIESCFEILGITPQDFPEIIGTPERIVKMWVNEFLRHKDGDFLKSLKTSPSNGYNQIVLMGRVQFVSFCAHHFLPFQGDAYVLYIPDKLLIGASKPSRIIDFYSRRPQIQENLTQDILDNVNHHINPKGAMVVLIGSHGCMTCRGVEQKNSNMVTSAVSGVFLSEKDKELKGMEMIKLSRNNGE